jgi:predicted outer membrane repeat protein
MNIHSTPRFLLSVLIVALTLLNTVNSDGGDAHRPSPRNGGNGDRSFLDLLLIFLSVNDPNSKYERSKFRCLYLFKDDCICRERGLLRAIKENKDTRICRDTTLKLSKEINVTGKSFALTCDPVFENTGETAQSSCILSPKGDTRLFVGSPKNASFRGVTFTGASSDGDGGAAWFTGGLINFSDCTFRDNKASGSGGALSLTGESTTICLGCRFIQNQAKMNGGAISANGATTVVTLAITTFTFSTATNGGSLNVEDGAKLSTLDTVLFENSQADKNGGAIHVNGARVLFLATVWFGAGITISSGSNPIWIADDGDPSGSGSLVDCGKLSYPKNMIGEFAGGPQSTQLYNNTNCVFQG